MKPLKRLTGISLKNKIFFSILAVLLVISLVTAFLSRWLLVSSLISELELRGIAIARTIAERGSSYMLDKNYTLLLSLIFDELQLKERKHLIVYIFVADQDDNVISHTFTHPFPPDLKRANPVPPGEAKSLELVKVGSHVAYDIALPVKEGIYSIGTVHVGLNKGHIDHLVSTLRTTFLGFLSLVIVIFFIMSHMLAKYITRPITELTKVSDELSRGNFDIKLDLGSVTDGWDLTECPAYVNTDLPCWHFDEMTAAEFGTEAAPLDPKLCRDCVFYRKRSGDEVVQLADSFHNMVWSIKLYRRRLHESEEKYRSLFDYGPDPIFVVDSDTLRIVDVNPRALDLYGYTKDELVETSFLALEAEMGGKTTASLAQCCDMPGGVTFQKVVHLKKGNKPFYANLHACHITYRGRPAIVIAATDITEMMEKDAQLIQASKMKSLGEMSAGIAHEINQPLNAIKMGSEYLAMMVERNAEIPPDQLHQVVTEMSAQVDRAADIINTLRAFGRKADLVKEKVDLNHPVRGVFSIVGRQFELDDIRIDLELTPGLSPVLAHNNRLQQVFFNLVTNARDAIHEKNESRPGCKGGVITIRSLEAEGRVIVEVADNGAGIPEAIQQKIFEPFFSTKETSHDMGLGLAITYGIVKDYGGDIQVRSREGEGTTFVLSFPAAG